MTYKNTLSTLAHQFRAHLALLLVGTLVLTTSCNDAKDKKNEATVEEITEEIKEGELEKITETADALVPKIVKVKSFQGKNINTYKDNVLAAIEGTVVSEKFTKDNKKGLKKAVGLVKVTKKRVGNSAVANVDDAFSVAFGEHGLAYFTKDYTMKRVISVNGAEVTLDLIALGNSFVKLENKGEMTKEMVNFVKIHVKQENGKFPVGKFTADDDSRASVKAVLKLMGKLDDA